MGVQRPSAPRVDIRFDDLPNWSAREAAALLMGLARHFDPAVASRPHQAPWLSQLRQQLGEPSDPLTTVHQLFRPRRILADGFLTGYYEPIIKAQRTRGGAFQTPLYKRPPELVRTPPRDDLPGDGTFGRQMADGTIAPMPDRAAIEAGALAGRGLELAWLEDPVDAFFAQVQGSARLHLEDGTQIRIGYHGKTGHPYTAIGRVLIDRGVLPEGGATMETIRTALKTDPSLVAPTLAANRSFVFFRVRPSAGDDLGPVAGGGVALVPMRSLAVDRSEIALGTPVFVETILPTGDRFTGVMIAEDTGSAIIGPARGDIFFGSGPEAGAIAGDMKAPARFTVIEPAFLP